MSDEMLAWAESLALEIKTAFPEVDRERCRYLRDKLQAFDHASARAGVNEYITRGGDELFKVGRLLAIVNRHFSQATEQRDRAARAGAITQEQQDFESRKLLLEYADKVIAEMDDDDVRREWAPILAGMKGKTREWAEKWDMAKIRANMQLRLKIAGLLHHV